MPDRSSPDGIDIAVEVAVEELCEQLPDNPDFILALKEALPGLYGLYGHGFRMGRMEPE